MRVTMKRLGVAYFLLLSACVPRSCARDVAPGSGFDCCQGDILLLLDSSGSISFYEFSRMLHFLAGLLHPFQVGRGHVRVALVQVDTKPRVEFDFDAHRNQNTLQDALLRTPQLHGDTKTETALLLAQQLLGQPSGQLAPPRVLLWLTDGVEPGNVDGPIAALHREGVSVLAVSTGHSNYQLFSRAVTPPIEQHLFFVDPDYMDIITKDLREAITELLCTECLHVRDVTSHSAVVHWWPIRTGELSQYELQFGEAAWSIKTYRKITLSPDHTWTELTDLQSDTHYSVHLTPHTPYSTHSTLSAVFTTLPDVLCPTTVMVSESGPDRLRVNWLSVESGQVEQYRVEFGPIPRGDVRSVMLSRTQNSILLTQLQPDTHYLITISAVHSSGQEGAISIKACTQEVLPGIHDLQLTQMGFDLKVDWMAPEQGTGLQGYWVKWETGASFSPSFSSSRYLPAQSLSTVLTHLNPTTRVCVSPVYRTALGEEVCCTMHTHTQLLREQRDGSRI